MSTPAAPSAERALLFDWDHRTPRKLSLVGCFALSIALHAVGFCIFQVVYPPTLALLPPPARVSLIVSDSEEGRTLLSWIEAEDPALASVTQPPADSKVHALPKLRHIPSYITSQPAFISVPPLAPDLRVPPVEAFGPVSVRQAKPPLAITPVTTVVAFSGEIGKRDVHQPAPKFELSSNESPQNARFLVAVSPAGEVRYSFIQQSSGDAALDRQAAAHLALCRLSPDGETGKSNDLVWTTAEFQWGNDLAAPSSPPEPAP